MKYKTTAITVALASILGLGIHSMASKGGNSNNGRGNSRNGHSDLPSHADLKEVLRAVVEAAQDGSDPNGGLSNDMWATLVNRDGEVCAVAFSGEDRGEQWPGSRVISAQKANTANAFSLPTSTSSPTAGLSLSTANLYAAVQPGGSLFGLQHSNPVNTLVAYAGPSRNYGQHNDPMVGRKIGGVNVFGGGLALYDEDQKLIGAIGVSGDTACTDHIVAWKVRDALGLDHVPGGISATGDDNIIFPENAGDPPLGFEHPRCGFGEEDIAEDLPNSHPIGTTP